MLLFAGECAILEYTQQQTFYGQENWRTRLLSKWIGEFLFLVLRG
jgi:hypothetical protein